MKLKKPKKTDYDFFAIHLNGKDVSIVYVDDSAETCDGAFPCYEIMKDGGTDIANGYLVIEAADLRVLPFMVFK